MKNSLLLLAGAVAFSLTSCSQDKTGTTTATDGTTTTTTTTTMSGGAESEAAMEARAQRIADKMVADMKITDEATKTKIRTVYVNRARRLGEVRTKYTADTTGMATAMREATTETDTEFKGVFTDPAQYQSYETSRSTYDESNYVDDATSADGSMSSGSGSMSSDGSMDGSTSGSSMSSGSTTDNSAMSSSDGTMDASKVKVKRDGDVKIKDSEGNKAKIDGDDGTMKMKPAAGGKTKVE
ncbi:hypothetical protein [uncultured Hymenobacter sp.]|uniref:hypothetical protein n=1 Tax=uncultured Hymenobacter sp. TaxID=170016 RepID=UPI0035CB8E12